MREGLLTIRCPLNASRRDFSQIACAALSLAENLRTRFFAVRFGEPLEAPLVGDGAASALAGDSILSFLDIDGMGRLSVDRQRL